MDTRGSKLRCMPYPLSELALLELCSRQHVTSLSFPGFVKVLGLHVLGFHSLLTLLQMADSSNCAQLILHKPAADPHDTGYCGASAAYC